MISKIHVSPPEIMIQKEVGKAVGPAGTRGTAGTSVFIKDQIVTAKVLAILSPGKAQISVNGQTMIVKTGLLLSPGEELKLTVVQEKDAVLLKLLGPSRAAETGGTKQLVSLVHFLSKKNALPDIAGIKNLVLQAILQESALKSGTRDDRFLPRLIENSGMMWEKKMASLVKMQGQGTDNLNLIQLQQQDLKGALLNLLAMAAQKGGAPEKTVSGVLDTLENFQLLNTQTSESGRYLIPFPVFFGSDLNFGQLLIDTGDKKEDMNSDGQKMIRVSFLLDMTHLGTVRADFSILKKAITGRFLLENDGVCEYMKSIIPELKTRFEQIEYLVGNIDCLTAANAQIHPDVLMESLFENRDASVLNIVI